MDENDVSTLKFDKDFEGINLLSNAEVAIILEKGKKEHEMQGIPGEIGVEADMGDAFNKTLAYAKRFSGYTDTLSDSSSIHALREELYNKSFVTIDHEGGVQERKLHPFEIVAMLNLEPEDYDEAVALIPSLQHKFDEKEIEEVLSLIATSKNKF